MLLTACERRFTLECSEPHHESLLEAIFGALLCPEESEVSPASSLGRVAGGVAGAGWTLQTQGASVRTGETAAELIYEIDKDLTIALQRARPDLLFLHAAVVESGGSAIVLSAPTGTGKSTTAFALLHHGLGYLSDELAPIDVANGMVHPYPHALCLKSVPPAPYRLPPGTLDAGETLHVPVKVLPSMPALRPLPISAFVFLRRHQSGSGAVLQPLTVAAASAHLLSNCLNALAHNSQGADAALTLARRTPAFWLDVAELPSAIAAVQTLLSNED